MPAPSQSSYAMPLSEVDFVKLARLSVHCTYDHFWGVDWEAWSSDVDGVLNLTGSYDKLLNRIKKRR